MTNPINSTDRTYMWKSQPYVTWKGNDYNQASLVNARPETNGSWILSNQGSGKDGNAFLPRPIKHWRKQLASNTIRGGTENVTISEIDRPGLYNMLNNNSCCDISKNSSSIVSDIQVKNNSTIYDNSESVVTYADVSNCWSGPIGKRICCNPEANLIKYKTAPVEKNYISYSYYLQSRCFYYNQNISTTKVKGNAYFNSNGIAAYPANLPKGCQVLQKKDCANDCCNCNCGTNSKIQNTIYKPNNRQFAKQGATSSKSRINALRENTIDKGGALFNNAYGLQQINNGICSINGDSIYYVKTKPTPCIQTKCGPAYIPPPPPPPIEFIWYDAQGNTFTFEGNDIAYNGFDRWVAVGSGTYSILISTDGITWSDVNGSKFNPVVGGKSVFYGNGRWVAVGGSSGNTILYSDDNGSTWNSGTGTKFDMYGRKIIFANNKWVALGNDTTGNTILTSTDGIIWATVGGTKFNIVGNDIKYENNLWVALGKGGNTILYSDDNALTWKTTTTQFTTEGNKLKYDNSSNRWVSVGEGTYTILTSGDGINWNNVDLINGFTFSLRGNSVAYGNGRWVAVGQSDNKILTSTDSLVWNKTTGSIFSVDGTDVAFGDNNWVAVGAINASTNILTSLDGVNWNIPIGSKFDGFGFGKVVLYGNRWVALGYKGTSSTAKTILYADYL